MKKKLLVAAAALTVIGGSVGVLQSSAEENTVYQEPATVQTSNYLSKDEALEIAFAHAEVSRDEVQVEKVEFDKDDGIPHYEIEFEKGQTEYEYDIHAESGKILDSEIDHDYKETNKKKNTAQEEFITQEKALERAIAHAGVSAESITLEELELSKDDGFVYYEIEFKSQGTEYEYDIDAITAEVLDYEIDNHDDSEVVRGTGNETSPEATPAPVAEVEQPVQKAAPETQQPVQKTEQNSHEPAPKAEAPKQEAPKQLTMEEARDIALAHAGVSLDTVYMDEAELDEDDGRLVWEFEFESASLEIEADVDAYSGAILDFEKENND